jgi:hypothetical protein
MKASPYHVSSRIALLGIALILDRCGDFAVQ